jgi:hypothetical protein
MIAKNCPDFLPDSGRPGPDEGLLVGTEDPAIVDLPVAQGTEHEDLPLEIRALSHPPPVPGEEMDLQEI